MTASSRPARSDPWLLLALPPLLGLALIAGYLVVEAVRPGTLTAPRPTTIPEAIAVGNGPRALEMIAEGLDVNAPALVRRGLIDDFEYEVTPLEAALLAQRIEVVRLLMTTGADVARSPRAACLAHVQLPEALPILGLEASAAPADSVRACVTPPPHGQSERRQWPVQRRAPETST